MGRRERLEGKLSKREEWAGKAAGRANMRFTAARTIGAGIPFGQPILVGHHSEKRHRADAARITGNMAKGCEEQSLAAHHEQKAAGLERQLANTIFSDDENAVEALEAKIAKLEKKQALAKGINAAIRKNAKKGPEAQKVALMALGFTEEQAAGCLAPDDWSFGRQGVPSYVTTNNAANIRRLKQRLEQVKTQQDRTAKAEQLGVLVEGTGEYCRVTFPEKPAREVLEALRAAGFMWGGGSWTGKREQLPAEVQAELEAQKEAA